MQTQFDDASKAASPKRVTRRRQTPAQTPTWQREQSRMVDQIADHALRGGSERAGPGATDEQAIDAYLEVMRRDLLAFARRGG